MAEKKKTDKKEKSVAKKVVASKTLGVKPQKIAEDKYPAFRIAENLNISEFSFYIMKQEADIDDNSFLTISEFQELYNEIVGR